MPSYYQNMPGSGTIPYGTLPKRTLDYLAHGARKGERNAELFEAATQFRDAGYSIGQAENRLLPVAVNDGLTESETKKTIKSAFDAPARAPIGKPAARTTSNPSPPTNSSVPRPTPSANGNGAAIPNPLTEGFKLILQTAFLPGEYVALSEVLTDASGDRHPGPGQTLLQERWLAKIAGVPIEQIYSSPDGCFIRINPMKPNGKTDKEVTNYRHGLVEFDLAPNGNRIPKLVQYQALIDSGLPFSVVLDSGDKSIHGWCKLDAGTDYELYKARRDHVYEVFAAWNLDPKNKNPSRYSRCPDVPRNLYDNQNKLIGVGRQVLLALNIGPASWTEYEANQAQSEREKIRRLLMPERIEKLSNVIPSQLIKGVLYRGGKMSFAGGSKTFKSWNVMHLCFCIANGLVYLGFETEKGPVVYWDFELMPFEIRQRFEKIAAVYRNDIQGDPFENLRIRSLRSVPIDFGDPNAQAVIAEIVTEGNYAGFCLDPLYKALVGYDENSAGEVSKILRPFDCLTTNANASLLYNQHFSKGNQASKDPIDRISGSGAFARDPDAIALFTQHRLPGCFVVNFVLRSFEQVPAFVVRWKYPVFIRDDSLDPEEISRRSGITNSKADSGGVQTNPNDEKILAVVKAAENGGGLTFKEILSATSLAKSSLNRRLKRLIEAGQIMFSVLEKKYQLSPSAAAKWKTDTDQ